MKKVPEEYRVRDGQMASDESFGNNGYFQVYFKGFTFDVIAGDGYGWDHVSVSNPKITPNWETMCFIKDLFFSEEECCMQFHPPKDEYVNNHEHCLHIWKPQFEKISLPPSLLTGLKNV